MQLTHRLNVWLLLGVLALLAGSQRAAEACFMRAPQPVQVVLDKVEIEIHENVAIKKYDCHFRNPNGGAIVGGVCYMELSPDAQVDNMSMILNGVEVQSEILPVEKANEVFREIVAQGGSPALLEYYGNRLIRTQVPNIPAGGTVIAKLQYTQQLTPVSGVYRLSVLNTNPKMKMQVLDEAAVSIKIMSEHGVKNLYSPTHDIKIDETVEDGIMVRWSEQNYLPKNPFVLYWKLDDEKIGVSTVAHRDPDAEEGHFMVMASPTLGTSGDNVANVTDEDVMAKDIVFVVDSSGSMVQNNKMDQAKGALRYCVNNLRDGDRFNIVDFSTTARSFKNQMVEVTDETRQAALTYIDKMRARGGTAISEALNLALNQFAADDRLKMIFFATDGLPTIGERDADKLLDNVSKANANNVRIFAFGEGTAVNSRFLDMLAHENNGESDYILPEENIETKIATYFDRVGSPMLTNLTVSVEGEGVTVRDLYPRTLPDLFRGDRVVVFGSYEGSGPVTVTVKGLVNGVERTYVYETELPAEAEENEFVSRLWAGKKVQYLLGEVRRDGKDQELIDEIVRLATRYGIVTPYTAFLAVNDVAEARPGEVAQGAAQSFRRARQLEGNAAAPAPAAEALDEATRNADRLGQAFSGGRGDSEDMYAAAERERKAAGEDGSVLNVMRYIGSKTFYRNGDQWIESVYKPAEHEESLVELKADTEAYYALLAEHRGIAKYMAIGQGIFRYRGVFYRLLPADPREEGTDDNGTGEGDGDGTGEGDGTGDGMGDGDGDGSGDGSGDGTGDGDGDGE